ncbi:phytoene desaturase family protein [Ktedonospora formicarum]|uniref:Dehydrogenase n=1 Tax=Ktedonospora formicarum TaxID=2778364 RepID=A0A8J3HYQ6_9CHLR|nr:FAD-dependent oxidoreductase [Ktedonospora formicarum]GHO43463.1 dehydrogenase [Ktedonospora formicarum]
MNATNEQTEVIIVGGGMAGLAAASYLAKAGISVTLFEKSASLGGRAATQDYEGYLFNRGIHAIYTGGATSEVLKDLGVHYSYGIPKETFILRQGQLYPFPANSTSLLSSRLFSLGDKLELARLLSALPRLKAPELAHMSVQEWLERSIRRPLVRQFMASTARVFVYSSALNLVSAEVFLTKFQLILKNPVHYVNGGWQTLIDGLRRVAEQAGARIETGDRVTSVVYEQGSVQGVHLRNGETRSATHVILATSLQDALKLMGENSGLQDIVSPLIPARVACLDVALRRLPDSRHPVVQDLEHPLFLSAQSHYARITPEGGALIHTFKQLDPTRPTDPHQDEHELEDLLDAAQPGWRDLLVKRIFLPHIEAIGMLPTASSNGYAGRPGLTVPGISNLYLAGDWIGAGFLSDPSMSSARAAANLILQK